MGTMKLFPNAKGTSLRKMLPNQALAKISTLLHRKRQINQSKFDHWNLLMYSGFKCNPWKVSSTTWNLWRRIRAIVSLQQFSIQISESIWNKCQTLFSTMNTELKLCTIVEINGKNRKNIKNQLHRSSLRNNSILTL